MWRRHRRLFAAAALLAVLALARPSFAGESGPPPPSESEPPHPPPPIEPEPPHRWRAAAEIAGFLSITFVLLFLTAPPSGDPPGNVRLIDKLTLQAWSFDASAFETNFLAHPFAGTYYYTVARSNRIGPLESLGWASASALTWELAEFPENVSFNDLIVTPIAGTSIGESVVQLAQWLDRDPTVAHRVLSGVLFPMKLINGGPAPYRDPGGALAAHLRLVGGARVDGGGELGVSLASRLVRFPGFGDAGQGTQFGVGGNVSGLSLDGRASRSGLADLRFGAEAALATMYQRDIDAGGDGWDFLLSGGVAYDVRWHNWNGGQLDSWSSVHVPGVGLQLRRLAGPLQISLRADLAFTFGGARSFPLDNPAVALPIDTLTTTQRTWGYTMGWGLSAAPSLEIAWGPLSLQGGAAIDTRYAINGPDPWPDRHPSASISDSWSTVRGGAGVNLPWNDLQLSASLERNLRRGTAGPYERVAGETLALFGIGFAIR